MPANKREYKRTITLNLDPKNYNEFEGLALDFNTQKILGVRKGKRYPIIGGVSLQYSRGRNKGGRKVLHKSLSPNNESWFDINRQLLDYDHLIAIDTNTNCFYGSSVSITAAFHIIPRFHDSAQVFCHGSVIGLVEMWNVIEKPENLGWWQILQAIQKSPNSFIGTIGITVDSDLGNLEDFNSRERPIIHDYFLPPNMKLIYASDRGSPEHLSTKMIRYCHLLAADLYKEENLVLNICNLHKGLDGLYSHIRQWDAETRKLRPFAKNEL